MIPSPTDPTKPTIVQGDCVEVLKQLPDNSVDSIVTDPPYGIAFMGKRWDNMGDGRAFQAWAQTWTDECLRVLKPGGHILAFGSTRMAHRLACAVEDSGFEIRDSIAWLYGCLSDDTDALTRRGWVRGTELLPTDDVAQWDNGALSWVRPSKITVAPYTGPLVNLANRHTDQLLTPNHRVYAKVQTHARNQKPGGWTVTEAGDLRQSWIVDLPLSGVLDEGADVDPDRAYLTGWWFTDAWRHGDGKAAMFSQCKPATLAKLREALAPHDPSEYVRAPKSLNHSPEHAFYVTGELAADLINQWPTRTMDWSLLGWSLEARRALLEGLIDGDGSRQERQHTVTFWSKDAQRREIVAALFTSCGWRAADDGNAAVYANPRGTTQLQKRHRDAAPARDYEGDVWCVTVPAGAFVARRNGRPFVTGNSGFPKSHNVSKAIDKAAGAEREVVGPSKFAARKPNGSAGVHTDWLSKDAPGSDITAPATTEAQKWDGWGTSLKPAHEPVVVGRKPFTGTVAANVLEHGTGALNIDGCRVEGVPPSVPQPKFGVSDGVTEFGAGVGRNGEMSSAAGRWPANVILDEHTAAIVDEQSGVSVSKSFTGALPAGHAFAGATYGPTKADTGATSARGHNDSGGASRFFYQAKANKKERPIGPDGTAHPTVKPITLMRYLVRLVTPPGGVVVDPFAGSGTTIEAAILEGFRSIGIEYTPEYLPLIRSRVSRVNNG